MHPICPRVRSSSRSRFGVGLHCSSGLTFGEHGVVGDVDDCSVWFAENFRRDTVQCDSFRFLSSFFTSLQYFIESANIGHTNTFSAVFVRVQASAITGSVVVILRRLSIGAWREDCIASLLLLSSFFASLQYFIESADIGHTNTFSAVFIRVQASTITGSVVVILRRLTTGAWRESRVIAVATISPSSQDPVCLCRNHTLEQMVADSRPVDLRSAGILGDYVR